MLNLISSWLPRIATQLCLYISRNVLINALMRFLTNDPCIFFFNKVIF